MKRPSTGFRSRSSSCTIVDLPLPDGPTMPTASPGSTSNDTPFSTGSPARYENQTSSKLMRPMWSTSTPALGSERRLVERLALLELLEVGPGLDQAVVARLHLLAVGQGPHEDQHHGAEIGHAGAAGQVDAAHADEHEGDGDVLVERRHDLTEQPGAHGEVGRLVDPDVDPVDQALADVEGAHLLGQGDALGDRARRSRCWPRCWPSTAGGPPG